MAPDKFRGSLSAAEAADAIARGVRAAGGDVDLAPVADGGEGTLDVLVESLGGTIMGVISRGPLGAPVRAHIGRLADGTGVVEIAQASGLSLLAETERDPVRATTIGSGELIKGALARRPSRLIVALGGSATVDGGTGLAHALGVRFFDAAGGDWKPGVDRLTRIARVDPSRLDERWSAVKVIAAADVATPLTGPEGAARAFGPQKGATPAMVDELDLGLENLGRVLAQDLGITVADAPGAGAAGGAGAMLLALGATLQPGIEVVFDALGMQERIERADLVLTGEGRLDGTTFAGKAPAAVLNLATTARVPCEALVGESAVVDSGFSRIRTLMEHFGGEREVSMQRAAAGLQALGARAVSDRR